MVVWISLVLFMLLSEECFKGGEEGNSGLLSKILWICLKKKVVSIFENNLRKKFRSGKLIM